MGTVTARTWLIIHLAGLAVAAMVLLWVNRNQWFFGDEWEFFVNRGLVDPVLGIFVPHNEHWSTIPIVVFVILRDTVGIGSYWPYIAVLVAMHLALAHLLWRAAVRAGVAPLLAIGGSWVFAVLGAGSENILWAFQIGFVGSLAFGWSAALVVDRADRFCRRDWWAVGLLLCALMCSGIGVPAVAMVALLALARSRELVRPLIIGGVPTAVFLLWYLAAPQIAAPIPGTPPAQDGVVSLAKYVVSSVMHTLSETTGLPLFLTLLVLAALTLWALVAVVAVVGDREGSKRTAIALAGLGASVGFFVLSGFGRGQIDASRYVYVAIAFALPGLMLALSRLARPQWAQFVAAVILAAVLVTNMTMLVSDADEEAIREQLGKETILSAAGLLADGEHTISRQPDPALNPDVTASSLTRLMATGAIEPGPVTNDGLAWARLMLQTKVQPAMALDDWDSGRTLRVAEAADVTVQPDPTGKLPSTCLILFSDGADGTLTLETPGEPVHLGLSDPEGGYFRLSNAATSADNPVGVQQIWGGYPSVVPVLIDMAKGTRLNLAISSGQSIVCGVVLS